MMNSETIGILSLLVSVLAIIIAINQSKKAQKFQEKLAEAQNAFAKGEIKIEFFQCFFNNIIFVGNFPNKCGIEIPLEISVGNTGDKKIEKSEFYITYPDALHEWNTTNIKFSTKGSLKETKYKLVDKPKFMHMLAFDYGDITPKTVILHNDHLYISDYQKTNSTVLFGQTEAETKDNIRVNVEYVHLLEWTLQFFLRHDGGSHSKDCHIHFWNTIEKTFMQHVDLYLPKRDSNLFEHLKRQHDDFVNNYLKNFSLFYRFFFKNRLRKNWNRTARKSYLIIELELQKKDITKIPLPKNAPKDAKDYSIYHASVKNQKVLMELNCGDIVLIDRKDYEKRYKMSEFIIAKRFASQ